jgi:hypothetical protein
VVYAPKPRPAYHRALAAEGDRELTFKKLLLAKKGKFAKKGYKKAKHVSRVLRRESL